MLASIVKRFQFAFEEGDTGEAVLRDMRDQLTAQPGNPKLVFKHRDDAREDTLGRDTATSAL